MGEEVSGEARLGDSRLQLLAVAADRLMLAAKTQIYSQEVTFNCHFGAAGCHFLTVFCLTGCNVLYCAPLFWYVEILQFLLAAAAAVIAVVPCT